MAQNVLLACVMDLYLLGIHMGDEKFLDFFEEVQSAGAWIDLFH